ncbi:TPA: nucleoside recognition domain-containing protein [Klebsiella pneumoniae]|uniref:nucleoside recognition domain-containing protein n=1 Tax=Klebsiella pneumoniae TaxID=573 RepID=UPI000D74E57D|nr:nucleoside recognition domain-containing protein [Klebsiella pneumoniae]HBQ5948489.1 nucleoside recognition family protein [Klebsiella pneumoniae subsp. pneumoniae]EKZ6066542.1 nucleoside recognition family protein [Klebsiella pneumoniae]ELA0355753.1 nucleoside recognition family protein [Klebsiella pneumoniae]MBD7015575.1 nucleoside recognition family protein [Klebsiella pneumoniae]MBG1990521.1 nucleoside recognition family protein [Klebsiella pneumoniae]
MNIIEIIMSAGRSSVDIALYTLIPVMVVMMVMMKYLESVGVLAKLVNVVVPVLKPFGLTGLSLFALIQLNFVSFAAPVATLAMMEKKGASDRHLAATLAMLFAMGQANALYPLAPLGLHWITTVLLSIVGGLAAGAVTWYLPGRRLASKEVISTDDAQVHAPQKAGLLSIINGAGGESIRLSLGAVPMLILSLTIVGIIKSVGGISLLEQALSPVMQTLNIPAVLIMPALVKCLAGGTAYLGVTTELLKNGHMSVETLNASAGWLLQTFDLPGVGIMLGAGFRVARIAHFAIPGALLGIALRGILHAIVY